MSCEEYVRRAIEKVVAERRDGEQPCKYGNCVEFVDEQTGEVWGGVGSGQQTARAGTSDERIRDS